METLLGSHLPKPKDFVDMPYGTLAYICLAAATATYIFQPFAIFVQVTLFFAMLMFLMLAAGRDHLRDQRFTPEKFEENPDLFRLQIGNYDTTTRHMKQMAIGCVVLIVIASLRDYAASL